MSRWKQTKGWHPRGFACWDREWVEYKEIAGLQGMSVNGWMRSWLNEAVRYDKMNANEKREEVVVDQ